MMNDGQHTPTIAQILCLPQRGLPRAGIRPDADKANRGGM